MSDPDDLPAPDEGLLEFLGGIDEANEESDDADFSDFLATADLDRAAERREPAAEEKK